MAWRIVVQPNGKLARFSTIVDTFTDYGMNEEEAVAFCIEIFGMHPKDAVKKVQDGITAGDGRFLDAINTIAAVHGKKSANAWKKELSKKEQSDDNKNNEKSV